MSMLNTLLTRFELSQATLEEQCSDNFFRSLMTKIESFEDTAPYFGFTQSEIIEIHQDKHRERSRRLCMLWRWRCKYGSDATYLAIVKMFLQMEHQQLAEDVLKYSKNHVLSIESRLNPAGYSNWDSMSVSEQKKVKDQLRDENQTIREKYMFLTDEILNSLEDRNIEVDSLKQFIATFPKEFESATTLAGVLLIMHMSYSSWFNIRLFERVVERFGSDGDQEKMKAYKDFELVPYLQRSIFEIPSKSFGSGDVMAGLISLHLFLPDDAILTGVTGLDVEMIGLNLSQHVGITNGILHFIGYNEGSTILIFGVPEAILHEFRSNLEQYFSIDVMKKICIFKGDLTQVLPRVHQKSFIPSPHTVKRDVFLIEGITTKQPDDYREESIVIGSEKPLTSDEDLTKLETMIPTLTFMSDWHDKPDYYIVPEIKKHEVTAERLYQMILHNSVPIQSAAVAITGLPCCGKTTILSKLFEQSQTSSTNVQQFYKTVNDKCLSLYTVCIFGGYPFRKFYWTPSSERYSAAYVVFSDLVRTNFLRGVDPKELKFQPSPSSVQPNLFNDELHDNHLNVLFSECAKIHDRIAKKELEIGFFQTGLSIANGLDVGFNKCLHDFLSVIANNISKMVRCVFFSLERDIPSLSEPPELNHSKYKDRPDHSQINKGRSRLIYLLLHAAAGYDPETQKGPRTIMVGTMERNIPDAKAKDLLERAKKAVLSQAKSLGIEGVFYDKWLYVNPNNPNSVRNLRTVAEEIIIHNNYFRKTIPLKWIFLRSLIASVKHENPPIIMSLKLINELAKKVEMEEKAVESFLKIFTEFASLLYCPVFEFPFTDYVIVNIKGFTDLLDRLHHPKAENDEDNLIADYGIVTQSVAKRILGADVHIDIFMHMLMSVGMAAKVGCGRSVIPKVSSLSVELENYPSYFLPSARVSELCNGVKHDSVYIINNSEHVPVRTETLLARYIFKELQQTCKPTLIACKPFNLTKFRLTCTSTAVDSELHIIYHGKMTELRLLPASTANPQCVETCVCLLEVCCKAFCNEADFKRGLRFNIGLLCCANNSRYHYLYGDKDSDFCDECLQQNEKCPKRRCWIDASNKCESLSSIDHHRLQETSLSPEFIAELSNTLNGKSLNDQQEKEVIKALGLSQEEGDPLQSLEGYHGWQLFTILFLMWEKKMKKHKKGCTKNDLKDILNPFLAIIN